MVFSQCLLAFCSLVPLVHGIPASSEAKLLLPRISSSSSKLFFIIPGVLLPLCVIITLWYQCCYQPKVTTENLEKIRNAREKREAQRAANSSTPVAVSYPPTAYASRAAGQTPAAVEMMTPTQKQQVTNVDRNSGAAWEGMTLESSAGGGLSSGDGTGIVQEPKKGWGWRGGRGNDEVVR